MPLSSVVGAQSIVKPGVCTSSTRPASPYVGQCIYETDTLLAKVWNGSTWADYPEGKLTATTATTSAKNILINGDLRVWQRGTAVQFNNYQGAYAADRWCGSHQYQNSRTQRTSISSPPSGLLSQYALRSSSSTTAEQSIGTRMRIVQKVESANSYRLRGQQVTLSFWIRFSAATLSSVANSTTSNYLDFFYGVGSYTSTTDSATHTSAADTSFSEELVNGSLPTSWTKYTLTGTISSTANNVDVRFGFIGLGSTTSADTAWFELAQIQLEVGSVATPFEFEDYGTTLQKCQRYFGKSAGTTYSTPRYSDGVAIGMFFYKVSMRSSPTIVVTNIVGTNNPQGDTDAFFTYSSGAVSGQGQFTWTASAEL